LAALKALVEHPATSDVERENAEARIEEIKRRVRKAKEDGISFERSRMPTSMQEMANRVSRQGLASFKRRVRGIPDEPVVHDDWPFGWEGPREKVEDFEIGEFGEDKILGWKCPDCGTHVSRVITARMLLKFAGRKNAMKEYIERILSGENNQLCTKCWEKWDER
jgi:hypothetical protein